MTQRRFKMDFHGVDIENPNVSEDQDEAKSLTPWEWIDVLTIKKVSLGEAKRLYNFASYAPRMINRALCGDARSVDIIDAIVVNKALQKPEDHYEFLINVLDPVKLYCKWFFGKEDVDLASVREKWCNVNQRGTADFYSILDSRYGIERMLTDLEMENGGVITDKKKGKK